VGNVSVPCQTFTGATTGWQIALSVVPASKTPMQNHFFINPHFVSRRSFTARSVKSISFWSKRFLIPHIVQGILLFLVIFYVF
jgi:hypothetical protein